MYCQKCGKENKSDSNFCFNCGEKLNKDNMFESNNDYNDYYDYIFTSAKFKEQKVSKKYVINLNDTTKSMSIILLITLGVMALVVVGFFAINKDSLPISVFIPFAIWFCLLFGISVFTAVRVVRVSVNSNKAKKVLEEGKLQRAIITNQYERRGRYGLYFNIEFEYLVNDIKYATLQTLNVREYTKFSKGKIVNIKVLDNMGVLVN